VGAAVRLFDTAGVTRALSGGPAVAVTLDKPGPEILSKVRGRMQRGVLEALSSTVDIGVPGRFEVGLYELCSAAGLTEEQVRRALTSMDRSGVIEYGAPFRGRGIEKLIETPLPFDEVPIDWKRQRMRRRAEEEKLAAIEEYINCEGCRRGFILQYFGEKDTFQCGTCDRCDNKSSGRKAGPDVAATSPEVALPVMVCIHHLRFPLGKTRVAQIVTGSRDKNIIEWRQDKNPAYGAVRAGMEDTKEVIADLIREGYIKREGEAGRPVLTLTDIGARAAVNANLDDLSPAVPVDSDGAPRVKARFKTEEEVRLAALKCVAGLNASVGVMKIASILTGSKAKWISPIGADRLDVYGSVDDSQENVRETIKSMLDEGVLRKSGSNRYPVIELTKTGRGELEGIEAGSPQPTTEATTDALDTMIRQLLGAQPEQAKEMLPKLRMYNPREVARRLVMKFDNSDNSRIRARAVWAAGEMCGGHGLAFLTRCASSGETNIRRLAASALGKVAAAVCVESKHIAVEMEKAQQTLLKLAKDAAPQVRQYASKSLEQFPTKNSGEGGAQ